LAKIDRFLIEQQSIVYFFDQASLSVHFDLPFCLFGKNRTSRNFKTGVNGHAARRLQQERDAAVRSCSAW